MTDAELSHAFVSLDPGATARARMEENLNRDLDASQSSMIDEWLSLVRVRPVMTLGYATAAAGALLLTTPLGALSLALLK